MEYTVRSIIETALYFLVILNPASKVMFLAAYHPSLSWRTNLELSWKSTVAAFLILILLAASGQFMLERIFRVEQYSLQITGGLVVFLIGWNAIVKGYFIQQEHKELVESLTDLSLVPLAAPLIAGPGMIAASIASSIKDGFCFTCITLSIALLINFVLMLLSNSINQILTKTHLIGPLIRLTGLMIAIVAMQMMISGIRTCLSL